MENLLHFNPSQILTAHQQSIVNSLTSRFEAAKASRNEQLVQLLEQEKYQLFTPHHHHSAWQTLLSRLKTAQHRINKILFGGSTIQVSEFKSGSDHWWYAINPLTGECVYADSESELRLWIEENYSEK